MRLRNIKGCRDKIAENAFVVHNPQEYQNNWDKVFYTKRPLYLEIGTGKGKFITELAIKNPENQYIGIEKFSSVLIRALEKREILEIDNLLFLRMDAEEIVNVFGKEEVDGIYLNFSDPWPKDRHAKRRLASKRFLDRYQQILKPKGTVIFKTDNQELFDFSLEQAKLANWKILNMTYDLHHSKYVEGNIITEYEEKFLKEGKPICRMEICF